MKKTIQKGLTASLIVFLFGTVLASCGPIFDIGDDGPRNPTPTPPSPPADGYQSVKVSDSVDLADYLESDETSYAITLTDMEENDIYLTRNISIVKPMRIIGSSGTRYTLHATNRAGGSMFHCLDLQADLELQNCGFTGYNGTTGTGGGIAAGSPPLNIRAGKTLTMTGSNSVLELRGVGGGSAIRAGSQVKLKDGASILDDTGDLLFKAGVEKLIISGKVSLKNKLNIGEDAVLQIENNGQLIVEQGAVLTINEKIKELRIDGNIEIDRTSSSVGALSFTGSLTLVSLLEKITGNGTLDIENVIPETTTTPFQYGANTIVRLNSGGINFGKRIGSEIGGEIKTSASFTIPKGKKLAVGVGTDLIVNNQLTLEGGTLDVAGNVNVKGNSGQIIIKAENKFEAIPKGTVIIGSNGVITIDNGGTFTDESVSWDGKSFSFPWSYGSGSLVVKYSPNANSGVLAMANKNIVPDLLTLEQSTASSLTIKIGTVFTLAGTGTLTIPAGGLTLEGKFAVAGGAELKVTGANTFEVRFPNTLTGAATTQPAPKITVNSGKVDIYNTAAANNPSQELGYGTYVWSGSSPRWR